MVCQTKGLTSERVCLSAADVCHPSSSFDKKNIQLLLLSCPKLKQEMGIPINAVMLNIIALDTVRNGKQKNKLHTASNIPKLGEGFAVHTTH